MNLEKYQQYSRIARGLEKADLVLKNARIVNDMYVRDLLTAIFTWNLHWLHRLNW